MAEVAVDASALIDLFLGGPLGDAVATRLAGHGLHGPAHLDAECLSALGRLNRAGDLPAATVEQFLARLADAPITRHPVHELLTGAWARRVNLRLADALYVELADQLGIALVTTDARLGPVGFVEVIG
jgi:predicted nucleic acid-binding protein